MASTGHNIIFLSRAAYDSNGQLCSSLAILDFKAAKGDLFLV